MDNKKLEELEEKISFIKKHIKTINEVMNDCYLNRLSDDVFKGYIFEYFLLIELLAEEGKEVLIKEWSEK